MHCHEGQCGYFNERQLIAQSANMNIFGQKQQFDMKLPGKPAESVLFCLRLLNHTILTHNSEARHRHEQN